MSLDAFQNWIVQTGLMVSLLILIILVIRRPFARAFGANAAYALWSLPLIRLCLPSLKIPQDWLPEFIRNKIQQPVMEPLSEAAMTPVLSIMTPQNLEIGAQISSFENTDFGSVLIGIWLTITVLWMSYQCVQQSQFKARLFTQSSLPSERIASEILKATKQVGLKSIPNIRVSTEDIGPFVTGVFNPLIIIPRDFETRFDTPQRNFALVHEIAHIKRGDLWVALTILMFRAVNWPNPLVHFASHKLRIDQEAACDAFVVKVTGQQSAHSYAETLVKAVKQRSTLVEPKSHLALSLTPQNNEISKGD